MKFRLIFMPLAVVVLSCSIAPDGAIDYLPSAARLKTFTITGGDASLKGIVSYEGPFTAPSKITIDWQGDASLNRVPVATTASPNARISYELTGNKVTKISTTNANQVITRSETMSYNAQGLISKHVQTNNASNGGFLYELTSTFYYKDGLVDSIAQRVHWWDDAIWSGFIVRTTERIGNVGLYDQCSGGTYLQLSANYVSIMPYTPGMGYTLQNGFQQYFNQETQQYEYSYNDFQKSFYIINDPDEFYNIISSGGSIHQMQKYGEFVNECSTLNMSMSWEIYRGYYDYPFLGNYSGLMISFQGKDDQTMNPIYYHILTAPESEEGHPLLIPQADFLQILNKKLEFLYFTENRNNLPAASEDDIWLTKKNDTFELQNK